MSDKAQLENLHRALSAYTKKRERNKIEYYRPYPKQKEFHDMGADKVERLFSAGNQLGKTLAGAHECAFHLTGKYPAWWGGRKWDRGVRAWVGGESSTVIRDTSQKLLFGDLTEGEDRLGTGIIPADDIIDFSFSRGVAMGIDTAVVRHVSGQRSVVKFKSYEQQRVKWQGDTIDFGWMDEEPPADIYSEMLARFTATNGMSYMTFTPLRGMSTVVKRFKQEADETRGEVIMTAHDAAHIDEKALKAMLSKYPSHEHDCRINGVPMAGEGRIYQIDESYLRVEPIELPGYWPRIIGVDLGHGDHPTTGVWLAHDRDTDTLYVYKTYRRKGGSISEHAAAFQASGRIPVAWPHDAGAGDRVEGIALKDHYTKNHVNMLNESARYPDARGNSVWAGITEIQQMMEQGRLKVFSTCPEWFEEFRNYHLKDGKIVKQDDDLMDATRYAIMMRRKARLADTGWYPGKPSRPVQGKAPGTDFNVLDF